MNPRDPTGESSPFHPVFLTAEEVSTLRAVLKDSAAARGVAEESLFQRAAQDLATSWEIPPPFWAEEAIFADPLTGAPLNYDPARRGTYPTPDGRVLEGAPYDWSWDAITHDRNANTARRCALAGLLSSDERLLDRAKEILLKYAEVYGSYPPRGRQSATWGRLFYQALNESVWSLSLLWATECLWHAGRLTASEIQQVRDKLFLPLADLVWGEWYFIHNIRMWHNAAIGCIGLAFDQRDLIRHAIHGNMGFRQQLVDGYRWKDAFSCEGTLGYHGYGLTAELFLAEAMQRRGYDPYHDPHLLRAVLVPARMTQPDGTPPTLGDMGRAKALPTRIYATALGRYPENDEVREAAALAFSQWKEGGFRADWESSDWNDTSAYYFRSEVDWLLHWKHLPTGELASPRGQALSVFPDSGIAIARPEPDSYLLLKASARTGSHDHYDRLSFIWWEQGECWFDDPGTCYYSHPFHEGWFKHTASHNTALADGLRQERCAGQLVAAEESELRASVRPYPEAAPDVRLERRMRRIPSGWEDEFLSTSERSRSFDLLYHPRAEWKNPPAGGTSISYEADGLAAAVKNARAFPLSEISGPLQFAKADKILEMEFVSFPPDARLIIGEAPSNPQDQQTLLPFLCIRSAGGTTVTRMRVCRA